MDVTVVGTFDSVSLAEEARKALLAVGVLENRIAVDLSPDGPCIVGVHVESTFERDRIRDLLQSKGASCSEQRRA